MCVMVTGATGFLGNNVVRRLLETHQKVRVLVRENSDTRPLEGLDIEVVYGDVCDPSSVAEACQNAAVVIHCAGAVRIGWRGLELQRKINVQGTRHVGEAARRVGARFIHVSSIDALAVGQWDKPINEDSPQTSKLSCSYVVSKREAEQAVSDLLADGLDGLIVNPGFMLGPWDWKPSSGRMLLAVARNFTPIAPAGGTSVCDVRDVASGIIGAVENGQAGNNYILAGNNIPYFDLWKLFAEVSGGKAPIRKMRPIGEFIIGRAGDLWGTLTGTEPEVNSAAVILSNKVHYYSSDKAIAELGYEIRSAREIVESAWNWFVEHGYTK